MPNDPSQDTTIVREAGEIMAEAITHPLGFVIFIAGMVVLMWAYGRFVRGRPSVRERIAELEKKVGMASRRTP